jgi:excisionase family DNA binding protein
MARSKARRRPAPKLPMRRSKPVCPAAAPPPAPPPQYALNNGSQLLTVDEAAGLLNVGRNKIFDLIRDQRLVSVKIDKARRIRLSALQQYVDSL